MACCAFAAFLLVNLLAPVAALRRYLWGPPASRNAAVAWRYPAEAAARGDSTVAGRAIRGGSRPRWRIGVALLVIAELTGAAGAAVYLTPGSAGPSQAATDTRWEALVALHTRWCGPGPIEPASERSAETDP